MDSDTYTSGTVGTTMQVTVVSPAPYFDLTAAVFHRVIARRYEDAADTTTKRSERKALLDAALHHYLESDAEAS